MSLPIRKLTVVAETAGTPVADAAGRLVASTEDRRTAASLARDLNEITLSPGGQNTLIALIIDEFCARFTPGGKILYIGDADEKWSLFDDSEIGRLGIVVDSHGKMPDLVVYMPDREWLVLIEAASSHGPVDSKRRGELKSLFRNSSVGLVFISCFPSRAELRQNLQDIAWGTEVWCADNPTHLIHFDGERFLGPYETDQA